MAMALRSLARQLQQSVISLSHRLHGSPETNCSPPLQRIIADLRSLNGSTERDFLAVGGKLMEFSAAARSVSAQMTSLIELISGECGEEVSVALGRLLEEANRKNARIEQNGRTLASVQGLSRRILAAFSELRDTVSVFRALCTLTRIETVRLEGISSVFGSLAEDVKPLSESIHAGGVVIREAASRLDAKVREALERSSLVQARQRRELPPLIDGVEKALEALRERRETARRTSLQEAGQYRHMADAIHKLVNSLQRHDITRQQIEHVGEALEQLLPGTAAGLPLHAPAVLSLQSHQLWNAGEAFALSVGCIAHDLDTIAGRAREMADASRVLLEAAGDEQSSFFTQMENSLDAILRAVAAYEGERTDMQATAAGLLETIAHMHAAVSAIRAIEIQIERIAMNAAIGAIHIGAPGNALSRIAEDMQGLARNSNTNTEDAALALVEMEEEVLRMSRESEEGLRTDAADGYDPMAQIRTHLPQLRASSRAGCGRVNQIALASSQLCGEIAALREGFTAGMLFAAVVDRVCAELETIRGSADPDPAHIEHLDSLAKHYTMQQEREVHNRLLNGSAPSDAAPEEEPMPEPAEDDMENVEIF
jgi:hypothetical protein